MLPAGLERGGSNGDPGEGGARKKGGTTYTCRYGKVKRLRHALVETEINIKPALDQKLTGT